MDMKLLDGQLPSSWLLVTSGASLSSTHCHDLLPIQAGKADEFGASRDCKASHLFVVDGFAKPPLSVRSEVSLL